MNPRPRNSPVSDLSQILRSTIHNGRQTDCWRTSRTQPHEIEGRRLSVAADLKGSNELDASEDGADRVGCRYSAETSSSTWALRLVSFTAAEAEQDGHLGLARPFCVEYCLGLTTIPGLGFAMGNVFWYG